MRKELRDARGIRQILSKSYSDLFDHEEVNDTTLTDLEFTHRT